MNTMKKNEMKKQLVKISANVVKRIAVACQDVKLDKVTEQAINDCHTQAKCIDYCFRAKKTVNDTAKKLVELKLCKNENEALKRIKRHEKTDFKSRIVSRNAIY